MAGLVNFSYDGVGTVVATIHTPVNGDWYFLDSDVSFTPASAHNLGADPQVLTLNNIDTDGGLVAGDTFAVYVKEQTLNNFGQQAHGAIATTLFQVGNTAEFPFDATFAYNGGSGNGTCTVDVSFTVDDATTQYQLTIDGGLGNTDTSFGGPYALGSLQSLSVTWSHITNPADNFTGQLEGFTGNDDQKAWRTFARFSASAGTTGNPLVPVPPADVGIRIAFTNAAYDEDQSWVRIDDPTYPAVANSSNVVVSWETHRGRQYELDKTQAGTAVLNIVDSTGRFDPTNTNGPYYGSLLPLKQIKITAQNPCDGSYHDIFTGFTESWVFDFRDQAATLMDITLNCTDAFELLSRAEVVPDATGTTTFAPQQVDDRITAVLNDAGWPTSWRNIFTGNVDMQQTVYNPQTTTLAVMQDAADAEFPNAANVFMDRWGRVAFRGRWARFNPVAYEGRDVNSNPPLGSKQICVWNVGDFNAAETYGYAPISNIEWTLDLKNIINACLCWPYGLPQNLISGQLATDTGSIAQYGVRALSIPDLLITSSIAGPTSGTTPGGDGVGYPRSDLNNSGKIEAGYIGQYYVDNYAQPVEMISSITFQSISPQDSLGPAWWKFVTGVEIGDIVIVSQTNPGGGGFKQSQFYVEGIHNQVTLGSPSGPGRLAYPQWTMNLDLTPRNWYSVFAGVVYYNPPDTNPVTPAIPAATIPVNTVAPVVS